MADEPVFRFRQLVSLIAMFVIGGAGAALVNAEMQPVPFKLQSESEADGAAVAGQSLELNVKRTMNRYCPAVVDRQLDRYETINGKRVFIVRTLPRMSSAIVPAAEAEYQLRLDISPNTEPGLWNYRTRTTPDCSFLPTASANQTIVGPGVAVEVKPPTLPPPERTVIISPIPLDTPH